MHNLNPVAFWRSRGFKFGAAKFDKAEIQGCSRHMTDTLELLLSYVNKEGSSVAFGGNQKGRIKGYGMIVKGTKSLMLMA
ncbi:hypothetical protein OSB04_011557 [Centaurea solstitialis]|uniref:Uncharacterized protein n=1 Tax=Centaurea solstitialis TaxID=347529 RepID=A0AA38TUE4_9ASTR|nr:hypothetical protein OSB04_011557 [Centaurea solstitialis]